MKTTPLRHLYPFITDIQIVSSEHGGEKLTGGDFVAGSKSWNPNDSLEKEDLSVDVATDSEVQDRKVRNMRLICISR